AIAVRAPLSLGVGVVAGRGQRAEVVAVADLVAVLVVLGAAGPDRVAVAAGGDLGALVDVVGDAVVITVGDVEHVGADLGGWARGPARSRAGRRAPEVEGRRRAELPGAPVVAGAGSRIDDLAVAKDRADRQPRHRRDVDLEPAAQVEP